MMEGSVQIDRLSLTLGYPGVYSTFLLFAELSGKGYGVDARGIHNREAERMIR
jgi:4-hydroxy 2-oxovalerate aldolase/4-hydroxy-2-oxovalerate/4-hydroxy-2-oxohexanoate aldolase